MSSLSSTRAGGELPLTPRYPHWTCADLHSMTAVSLPQDPTRFKDPPRTQSQVLARSQSPRSQSQIPRSQNPASTSPQDQTRSELSAGPHGPIGLRDPFRTQDPSKSFMARSQNGPSKSIVASLWDLSQRDHQVPLELPPELGGPKLNMGPKLGPKATNNNQDDRTIAARRGNYPADCLCMPKSRRETVDDDMDDAFAERLPDTNNLIRGKNDSYAVGRKISQGRFGAVYEVLRKSDGKPFAAKLEVCDSHSHGLDMDCAVLSRAAKQGFPFFAHMIDRGKIESHFKFIIMQQMGQNLWKLRLSFEDARFSLSTALRLAYYCLDPIQQIHTLGFVHRDIKASNFVLVPTSQTMRIYLIDFGLCRSYRDTKGDFKQPREQVSFRGTTRYASLSAHNEVEQSPKDDLESWFYMIIEFITGFLPWSDFHRKDRDEVKALKENARTPEGQSELVKYTPKAEFRRILKYLDGLSYHNQPDYVYLSQLIQLAMKNHGVKIDEPFDWENID